MDRVGKKKTITEGPITGLTKPKLQSIDNISNSCYLCYLCYKAMVNFTRNL